jgi:TPR repeat protein
MKRRWMIVGITGMALIGAGVVVRAVHHHPQLVKRAAAYRNRAEQGDAKSQLALGGMYYYGKGVPKDYVEAARWYLKSADQRYSKAQYNLGYMYYYGYGALLRPTAYSSKLRLRATNMHSGRLSVIGREFQSTRVRV